VAKAVADRYGEYIDASFRYLEYAVQRGTDRELHEQVFHHLSTLPKSRGVRPALVKAAADISGFNDNLVERGACVQLVHEAMLITDDILDDSPKRRGIDSLIAKFGKVSATAVAWEFMTLAGEMVDEDKDARALIRKLTRQACVAEAVQDRERHTPRPLSIETWKGIARGDTGAIFALAVGLGGVEPEGCTAVEALAYLRHGLDDIEDLLDLEGDQADIRDHVPTLLTCFTDGTTGRQLRKAIPEALAWLRPFLKGYLVLGHSPRWEEPLKPFFADFALSWRSLESQYQRIQTKGQHESMT
jgi:hypothetical protein